MKAPLITHPSLSSSNNLSKKGLMTCDTWQVTRDKCFEDLEEKDRWLNQSISDGSACRTATPCLLNIGIHLMLGINSFISVCPKTKQSCYAGSSAVCGWLYLFTWETGALRQGLRLLQGIAGVLHCLVTDGVVLHKVPLPVHLWREKVLDINLQMLMLERKKGGRQQSLKIYLWWPWWRTSRSRRWSGRRSNSASCPCTSSHHLE